MHSFVSLFILNTCVTVCVSCASLSSSSSLGGVCPFSRFLSAHLVDLSLHFFWPKHTNDLRGSRQWRKTIFITLFVFGMWKVWFSVRRKIISKRAFHMRQWRKKNHPISLCKLDVVVGHQRFEQCFWTRSQCKPWPDVRIENMVEEFVQLCTL